MLRTPQLSLNLVQQVFLILTHKDMPDAKLPLCPC